MPSLAAAYALFDTPIGHCAVAWRAGVLVGTALPGEDETATRRAVAHRHPVAVERPPSPEVGQVIDRIRRLLAGEPVVLADVPLDWTDAPPFDRRVWELALTVAPGATMTYGEVAAAMGDAGWARSVGQALGRNPWPIVVPCHRVLASGGRPGGFSAPGAVRTKLRLLAIERARPYGEADLFSAPG